ncbi:MAG: hypothetical protein HRT35_02960 [Algicola sp.]|nr:hypothetical protein [Algicola sp.]
MLNQDFMLHVDLYVKGCTAEFYVNDIPVRRMDGEEEHFHSMVAHHLLVDGKNKLEIIVWPGDTPSKARQKSVLQDPEDRQGLPKVCARLMRYPVGAFAGDTKSGQIIMQLNWEFDPQNFINNPDPYPLAPSLEKDLGKHLGFWYWQQAEPVNLEIELPLITQVVKAIHEAFKMGDGQVITRYCAPYLRDMGKALPAYGETAFVNDMLRDVSANAGKDDWVEPFLPENHDFRLCGNGRIVEVVDKNWLPTVRTIPNESGKKYPLAMFLGKIKGKWYVLA